MSPVVHCPSCGYRANAYTAVGQRIKHRPENGDVSLCLACASPAVYAIGGRALRRPTPEERAEIMADPMIRRALAVLLATKAKDPEWPVGPDSPKAHR